MSRLVATRNFVYRIASRVSAAVTSGASLLGVALSIDGRGTTITGFATSGAGSITDEP